MSDLTTYPAALAWLFAQTRAGAPRDPARTRALLEAFHLASPPNTVHVVGTNGKGSVTQAVAAGLSAAGLRTGAFVSPHVEEFRERITVDGVQIDEQAVLEFVTHLKHLQPDAAFFELCYALALDHFERKQVAWAVVEAGVGAKNDATITLENVRAVVVTNVSTEHQATLGFALRDIARDKAAAVRPGAPVITAAQGEALAVVEEVAAERSSPLFTLSNSPLFALPPDFEASLYPFQQQNRRLAAATLRLLDVSEDAVRGSLMSQPLPGRREVFHIEGKTVIVDGGHNPAAARALRATLDAPYVLVFGALPKKQGAATLAALEADALTTIITWVEGQENTDLEPGRWVVPEPVEALVEALAACPARATVVVAGSLYLAGQVRPWLRDQLETSGTPTSAAAAPTLPSSAKKVRPVPD
ncbi:folylpolyglutamate synthase/dihydrofolate synthase family protein [soil metagenome]